MCSSQGGGKKPPLHHLRPQIRKRSQALEHPAGLDEKTSRGVKPGNLCAVKKGNLATWGEPNEQVAGERGRHIRRGGETGAVLGWQGGKGPSQGGEHPATPTDSPDFPE